MKSLTLNVILLLLIVVFSLPLVALYVLALVVLGGGWAYVGPDSCYFTLNPIGYAMIVVPVGVVLWRLLLRTFK